MSSANKFISREASPAEFIIRLGAPLLWAGIILWLSLTSSPPSIPGVLGWDKLLHTGAYGLLTLLIAQFLFYCSHRLAKPWLQAGLTAIGYGALLEVLQLLTSTGRSAEWWDLFADAVGAYLSYLMFRHFLGSGCSRRDRLDKGCRPRE